MQFTALTQLTKPEMTVYRPDGRPFITFDQLEAERRKAVERAEQAEAEVERLRRLLDAAVQRSIGSASLRVRSRPGMQQPCCE